MPAEPSETDASVVTVSRTARTRGLGRVAVVTAEVQAVVAPLPGPWGAGAAVVIEVVPEALVVDTDEAGGTGPDRSRPQSTAATRRAVGWRCRA